MPVFVLQMADWNKDGAHRLLLDGEEDDEVYDVTLAGRDVSVVSILVG